MNSSNKKKSVLSWGNGDGYRNTSQKRPNAEIRKPAHSKEQVRAINVSQLETEQWIQRLRGDKEDRTKTR